MTGDVLSFGLRRADRHFANANTLIEGARAMAGAVDASGRPGAVALIDEAIGELVAARQDLRQPEPIQNNNRRQGEA